MLRLLVMTLAIGGSIITWPAEAAQTSIDWRVENPFRFFADPADTAAHRTAAGQTGPVLEAERRLAAGTRYGWAQDVFLNTCWDLVRQDHSACGDLDAYINPRSHRISAKLTGSLPAGSKCIWRFKPKGGQTEAWRGTARPCGEPVRIDIPYPSGGNLEVTVDGTTVADRAIRVTDLFIVGLGDSYGSGEGNPDRPVRWLDDKVANFGQVRGRNLTGYPQRKPTPVAYRNHRLVGPSAFWLSQPCHRSLYSHQLRVALQLANEDPHRAVTFYGVSCSGSAITTGLLKRWKGVEYFPAAPRRSQIGQVAVAQCAGRGFAVRNYASSFTDGGRVPSLNGLALERCPPDRARKIDLVLLSIGGNDIGFARLVAYAILKDRSPLRRVSELAEQVYTPRQARARFSELGSRFKLLRRALHNHLHVPWDEPQRIVLTAYPKVAIKIDGRTACDGRTQSGLDGFPPYRLDPTRAAQAETVSAELNERLRKTARQYGWSFVEEHRQSFAGRGICAGHENGAGKRQDQLQLPRWMGQSWSPYPPSAYRPYAPRTRWIRTSNDAFMTAHVDLLSDLRRQRRGGDRYSPLDLLNASTFGGAFHPTAEGQAAIADAVLPVARRIVRPAGVN